MFGPRIPLFRLLGFQVNIDLSWFLVVILITWSLAAGLFPQMYEGLTAPTYWTMGVAGALGLFCSIVLHELGHSVVARRFDVHMRGITLFIFGGVAEMTDEPPSATAEFFIAIAGPIVSAVLGTTLLAAGFAMSAADAPAAVTGVMLYLGWINLILVAFNMIPAFPLDGGRVLRAALWQARGDLRWATRITATIGGVFGFVLIALGVFSFVSGNVIGGVWWFVLGMFLRAAANMSYQQVLVRRALEGETVARFMRRSPITVEPDLTVRELVEHFIYRYQHKLYPVVSGGALLGCVTVADVKGVPREQWDTRRVSDIMTQCSSRNSISPHADATRALQRLNETAASRLMVVEGDQLVGVIALKDLLGLLSMKIDLEGG